MLIPTLIMLFVGGCALGSAVTLPALLARLFEIRLLTGGFFKRHRDSLFLIVLFVAYGLYALTLYYGYQSLVAVHTIARASDDPAMRKSYILLGPSFPYKFHDGQQRSIRAEANGETIVVNDTGQTMTLTRHHYSKDPINGTIVSDFPVQVRPQQASHFSHSIVYFGPESPPTIIHVQQGTYVEDRYWLRYDSATPENDTTSLRAFLLFPGFAIGLLLPYFGIKKVALPHATP